MIFSSPTEYAIRGLSELAARGTLTFAVEQ